VVLDLFSVEANGTSSAFFTGDELQATSRKLQGKPVRTLSFRYAAMLAHSSLQLMATRFYRVEACHLRLVTGGFSRLSKTRFRPEMP
jgi:hypothetical protein